MGDGWVGGKMIIQCHVAHVALEVRIRKLHNNFDFLISENSWFYDLLYNRKKPQYQEPPKEQYQPPPPAYQPLYPEYQDQDIDQGYQEYQAPVPVPTSTIRIQTSRATQPTVRLSKN